MVTSQTLLLANQRTALDLLGRQLVASAALVKSLGGGWSVAELPGAGALGEAGEAGAAGAAGAARSAPAAAAAGS